MSDQPQSPRNFMTITTTNTINNSIENPSSPPILKNIIEFKDNDLDLNDIRNAALDKLDNEKFGWFHIRICMIAGIGFLTDSYDLFAINIVTVMLSYTYLKDNENVPILELWLKISAAVGTVIGQIFFGIYADKLGRKRIYGIELFIIIIATAGSMLSANSFAVSLFNSLIFWRLLLGIGIGGDYPLSAVITSEFSTKKRRGTMMAVVFAMQGVGIFLATIISIVTLKILEKKIQENDIYLDYAWRIVIGVGIIPAFIGLYFRLTISESPRWTMDVQGNVEKGARDVDAIIYYHSLIKPEEESFEPIFLATVPQPSFKDFCHYFSKTENLRNFIAICVAWFLLDVTFYGIGLNRETIIYNENNVNESNSSYQSLYDLIIGNIIITVVGTLPGYWFSVILIDKLGRRFIQLMGFAMLTLCYAILGFAYRAINNIVFILLLTLSMFFHNFGPNTTTFVIAGELFPTRYRSTCNGIAAACGKLGAIAAQIGFFKFKDIGGKNQFVDKLLQIFAILSFIGFLVTLLIPETKHHSLEKNSNEGQDDFIKSKIIYPGLSRDIRMYLNSLFHKNNNNNNNDNNNNNNYDNNYSQSRKLSGTGNYSSHSSLNSSSISPTSPTSDIPLYKINSSKDNNNKIDDDDDDDDDDNNRDYNSNNNNNNITLRSRYSESTTLTESTNPNTTSTSVRFTE
ncbi:hypothetical protein Glove_99g153 [Diversispora epigaea]|uniref:Major facilitator superfamily (MFS) profile domain-containing protein n=1 Tax=Diversispora epigaea TaxID=1348612 RepID=A0A397JE19_9GLOM|nr:hypothetical protein Glove_99g153 [Diversispora epigaea]